MSIRDDTYTNGTTTGADEMPRRLGLKRQAEASVHIDAAPEAVWAVVADVTRNGEWSGESQGSRWIDGANAAVQGARFKGRNLRRGLRWTRTCEVLKGDPPREFVWRTLWAVVYPDSTEWRIALEPEAGGTRVTEGFQIVRLSRPMEIVFHWLMPVHRDRTTDLHEDLQRLKSVVEAGATRSESALGGD